MSLACGCEMKPGEPVTSETLHAHYTHTFEVILFWEMIRRPGVIQDERHLKLSQARIDLIKAIDTLYPEAQEEP